MKNLELMSESQIYKLRYLEAAVSTVILSVVFAVSLILTAAYWKIG